MNITSHVSEMMAQAYDEILFTKEHDALDYVSFTLAPSLKKYAIYTNDLAIKDNSALSFLKNYAPLSFLIEKDYVLFWTTKRSVDIDYSYEYKIKKLAHNEMMKLIDYWRNDTAKKMIALFSAPCQIGKYHIGGLWFLGIEKIKNEVGHNKKIYFKCFGADDQGDLLYSDEYTGNLLTKCGVEEYNLLWSKAKIFLHNGFHCYMISLNSKEYVRYLKYKLYLIVDPKESISANRIKDIINIPYSDICCINNFVDNNRLYLQGVCLSVDTCDIESINLYYKEIK